MRLPVPGPRQLLDQVEEVVAAVPRVAGLLGTTEALLADVAGVVRRVGGILDAVEKVTADAATTVARVDGVVDAAEGVIRHVDTVAGDAEAQLARVAALLDTFEPHLRTLEPVVRRLAETTHEHEVDALVQLIDTAPELAHRLETELLPVMSSLGSVAPDLHDLLDVARELNLMMARMPGLRRVKRRVEDQQADAEAAAGAGPARG